MICINLQSQWETDNGKSRVHADERWARNRHLFSIGKGREAGKAFVTGDRALNVAYLNRGNSRIAAALSLRAVTDGKRHKEADMSDNLEILALGAVICALWFMRVLKIGSPGS